MGAVRDAETGTLYGVALRGDGLLFARDDTTATWRIARSGGVWIPGPFSLMPWGRRLIMLLGPGPPGRIAVPDLRAGDAGRMTQQGSGAPYAGPVDRRG